MIMIGKLLTAKLYFYDQKKFMKKKTLIEAFTKIHVVYRVFQNYSATAQLNTGFRISVVAQAYMLCKRKY